MSLAILGLEKSTMTLCFLNSSSYAIEILSAPLIEFTYFSMKSSLSWMFMKKPDFAGSPPPAYLSSIEEIASFASWSRLFTMACASSWQVAKPKDPFFLVIL
jgi:hypothetical protein